MSNAMTPHNIDDNYNILFLLIWLVHLFVFLAHQVVTVGTCGTSVQIKLLKNHQPGDV